MLFGENCNWHCKLEQKFIEQSLPENHTLSWKQSKDTMHPVNSKTRID